MVPVLRFFAVLLAWLRSSQARREAEILYLRQQLIVLKRSKPARPRLKATEPFDLRLPLPPVPFPARRVDHLQARDSAALAPNWLSPILALEVATTGWSTCS